MPFLIFFGAGLAAWFLIKWLNAANEQAVRDESERQKKEDQKRWKAQGEAEGEMVGARVAEVESAQDERKAAYHAKASNLVKAGQIKRDVDIANEPIVCANGHRYYYRDFEFISGYHSSTATEIEHRKEYTTGITQHGGSGTETLYNRDYDRVGVSEQNYSGLSTHTASQDVYLPVTQSSASTQTKFGCPVCHTSLFTWANSYMVSFIECQRNLPLHIAGWEADDEFPAARDLGCYWGQRRDRYGLKREGWCSLYNITRSDGTKEEVVKYWVCDTQICLGHWHFQHAECPRCIWAMHQNGGGSEMPSEAQAVKAKVVQRQKLKGARSARRP